MPSGVHFQVIESSSSEFRCTSWIRIQSETNSSSWSAVVILFCSALSQELFVSSCATILLFLCTKSKSCGARFLGASPSNQAWCQNLAIFPLPIGRTKVCCQYAILAVGQLTKQWPPVAFSSPFRRKGRWRRKVSRGEQVGYHSKQRPVWEPAA